MKIFANRELSDLFKERRYSLELEIDSENENRLLNVNETEYIDYLVNRYRIEPLVFDWNGLQVSDREEMIPAERFPRGFNVYAGKRYRKQVIAYHIPYCGEKELLTCIPSCRISWTIEVYLVGECVCFDIVNWRDSSEEIKHEADNILGHIRRQADNVTSGVNNYNQKLVDETRQKVQARKALLLKRAGVMASLGVPISKAQQVPVTFAVPTVVKKVVVKPSAPITPYSPDPTLDAMTYQEILRIIHETGVEMERHPNIYSGKGEESLRDHFIMVLSPHFQSVTGETFNRAGKTDILIRHEKANVFVAECKFWKGMKAFFETIDQILGYLTWRDSKSAILDFGKFSSCCQVVSKT